MTLRRGLVSIGLLGHKAVFSSVAPAANTSASKLLLSTSAEDVLGTNKRTGRVTGETSENKEEGDTYFATPEYPGSTPDDNSAGAASRTAASSKSQHPPDYADTSSMNDPAGKAKEPGGAHSNHVHHPGREADINSAAGSGGSSMGSFKDNSGSKMGYATGTDHLTGKQKPVDGAGGYGGPTAGSDRVVEGYKGVDTDDKGPRVLKGGPNSSSGADSDELEGGKTGGIAGAWRATTADFAAGGDDMTGGGSAGTVADDQGMKVNAASGLPELNTPEDAGACAGGFGQKRDPTEVSEQGETARQTEKSTGQVPADASSG